MNLTFSFGGAFVFGMVINFLSDAINARVEGLKKGKSKVVEAGHTLILGWNDRILPLVEQVPSHSLSPLFHCECSVAHTLSGSLAVTGDIYRSNTL